MRLFYHGPQCSYAVQVSSREVRAFNAHWPCSSLPDCSITFCFDDNGLCDILPYAVADKVSGPEAVALSQDAQEYAAARILQVGR